MSLSAKRERFVVEYLKDGNATQAAIRAGYSAKSADVLGPRLTAIAEVAEEIRRRREKFSAKTGLTVERLDQSLTKLLDEVDAGGPDMKLSERVKPVELGYKRLGVLREQPAFSVGALTIVIQE